MIEVICNAFGSFCIGLMNVIHFFEPFVRAYIDYYKDAFATGNLIVIALAFVLNATALWAVGDFLKWIFRFGRSKA